LALAAALLRVRSILCIGDVAFESGQKKCAESVSIRVRIGDPVLLDQADEEALGQVSRIFRGLSSAACESIQRRPVSAAKKPLVRAWRLPTLNLQRPAPRSSGWQ
jgi:hypothetical protein